MMPGKFFRCFYFKMFIFLVNPIVIDKLKKQIMLDLTYMTQRSHLDVFEVINLVSTIFKGT